MARRVQQFGGRHTDTKQDVIVHYLKAYATALHAKGLHLSYVDAFCGAGWRVPAGLPTQHEPDLFGDHKGPEPRANTALDALRLRPPFDRYVFGDTDQGHLEALAREIAELRVHDPSTPEAVLLNEDANRLVALECQRLATNGTFRAVMFLDPFGMQVSWPTLEAIQSSGKVDLWLLIPTGIALARLIPTKGPPSKRWEDGLTRFFGNDEWRRLQVQQVDLFGDTRARRNVPVGSVVRFVMDRLRTLFDEGLYPHLLELRIRYNIDYHLVFACSSPSRDARSLAFRIAGHLLNRAQNVSQAGN
jgi:three-Cys-motif partner protein